MVQGQDKNVQHHIVMVRKNIFTK